MNFRVFLLCLSAIHFTKTQGNQPILPGAPNVNLRKTSVPKMIEDLEFSEH